MKREARQAVHSVYRLFGRSALRLTYRRKDDEPLAPVLPSGMGACVLSGALLQCADVVDGLALEAESMYGRRSEAWLYLRALEELLREAGLQMEREWQEASGSGVNREGGED